MGEIDEIELFSGCFVSAFPRREDDVVSPAVSVVTAPPSHLLLADMERGRLISHLGHLDAELDKFSTSLAHVLSKLGSPDATTDGVTLLQLRAYCMIEYLEMLMLYVRGRATGDKDAIETAIRGVLSNEVVLERVGPLGRAIEPRVRRYQAMAQQKPEELLRPRPESVMDDAGALREVRAAAAYQPPRAQPVAYRPKTQTRTGDVRLGGARIDTGMPRRLTPTDPGVAHTDTVLCAEREREELEEDLMRRLPETKAERTRRRRSMAGGGLQGLWRVGEGGGGSEHRGKRHHRREHK